MPEITVICGPTASGKSALAVALAMKRNGTIINADSMQIYAALPILSAQPGPEDKARVPHLLYGLLPPNQKTSAQDWRTRAQGAITETLAANRHPVVVGGTGLYLKALIEGLSPIPVVPPAVRAQSAALQQELGNPAFHAALAAIDPIMAQRLNPGDTQRLIRAHEVITATGRSLAAWQTGPAQAPPPDWHFTVIIKTPARATLQERCDARFDWMMENGALEEVRAAIALPDDAAIANALGFRPLRDFIQGVIPRAQAIERAKTQTRQYAKRQDTWFRHQIHPHRGIDTIQRVP